MGIKDLCKLLDGTGDGKTGSCSGEQGPAQLIQLSADEWGCTPSLVVTWSEAMQPWGLQALW